MRPTAARIRQLLDYDPETGVFTWRVSPARSIVAGTVAGRIKAGSAGGYREISIDGTKHRASHLAWLYMKGEWPSSQVDHRDRDRKNDRLDNLRLATVAQNQGNTIKRSTNTSGFKGVSVHKASGRIRASIGKKHIGYFDTLEQAHAAYVVAAQERFGEFARA